MYDQERKVHSKHVPADTQARVFAVKSTVVKAYLHETRWDSEKKEQVPVPVAEQVWEEDDPNEEILYAYFTPHVSGKGGIVKFDLHDADLYDQAGIDAMRVMLDQIEESGVLESD